MVRQVKKIFSIMIIMLMLCSAICATASAESYITYDGNLSSTYTTYFRDVLSNSKITDNYVYFRGGQYDYYLVVGDLDFNANSFSNNGTVKVYSITNESGTNYNSTQIYEVNELDRFSLSVGDKIVYSDLGDFPQLEERGQRYEILQTILICVIGLCFVIRSIFFYRKR